MLGLIAKKLFGSADDRQLKTYAKRVAAIGALEPEMAGLSDDELRGRAAAFRAAVAAGASLDSLLVAAVREGAKRVLGMRHFDVQLIGGMVLHEGAVAEMRTGEGKTLVAPLACYLEALAGRGVHVVTVNDYLARRDAETMGRLYECLGLSVGVIVHGIDAGRAAAYAADVTYGTNIEFGFDYLRDNMRLHLSQTVQRGHAFAVVDEVDSILIDEARTPLIISGPSEDESGLYVSIDRLVQELGAQDYEIDENKRTTCLTEAGNERIEELLKSAGLLDDGSLYEASNTALVHHVTQALRAHKLYHRDKDHVVRDGQVVIVDEYAGRMMPGRRYGEGLHQAIEGKEGVAVQPESVTYATVTFQNYFRLYDKLAGMTGTAATESREFAEIYRLDVVEIPTNRPVTRTDSEDEVYRTEAGKLAAVVAEIEAANDAGQPVLVGTTSIEKSQQLARIMVARGFTQIDFAADGARDSLYAAARSGKPSRSFAVLNAGFHETEASVVAEAGVPGAVTIATNMAGRGADIHMGGSLEMRLRAECSGLEGAAREGQEASVRAEVAAFERQALEAGGLYVVGTERGESRRIDNQLRGRAGRQGDPGKSKFFLSLQDDLMRVFGAERMDAMLVRLGLGEGEAIVHPWVGKALEKAQRKVESRNYDQRKDVLKYDDVMNEQRKVVFEQRREMMGRDSIAEIVAEMRDGVVDDIVPAHLPKDACPEASRRRRPARRRREAPEHGPARGRMGQGGGHRRRGDEGADRQGGRRGLCGARKGLAGGGEAGRKARRDDRPRRVVAGAPAHARPLEAGRRLARHRPARPAGRIQARGLRPARRDDRPTARKRHGHPDARRGREGGAQPDPQPGLHGSHVDPASGIDEMAGIEADSAPSRAVLAARPAAE
jgi:preprotein translocase subunit SecA